MPTHTEAERKKRTSLAKRLGRATRQGFKNFGSVVGSVVDPVVGTAKMAAGNVSQAATDFGEGFTGSPARIPLGDQAQRSAGANATQDTSLGNQDFSGVGSASADPTDTSPSARNRASRVERDLLLSQRTESPGQQGTRIGAESGGARLSTGGGTVSTVGAQQSTVGRDRALDQLEALRRIRGSSSTGSTSSSEQPPSEFVQEREARNDRIRLNSQLGDIDRAIKRGAISARAGLAAKEKIRSNVSQEDQESLQLAQQAEQFDARARLDSRGLDIKERGLAADQAASASRALASGQESARKQANTDRQFNLDVAKFGLGEANRRDKARISESKLGLDVLAEQRKSQETRIKGQRARVGQIKAIEGFAKSQFEGNFNSDQAFSAIESVAGSQEEAEDLILKFADPERLGEGSIARAKYDAIIKKRLKEEQDRRQQ